MFRQAYPKNHQQLFYSYIVERINWLNDWYGSEEGYPFRELKAWAEGYAQQHELSDPEVDWGQYIEAEEEEYNAD